MGAPACCRTLDCSIDLLALHAHAPDRYPFLLESVAQGTPQARFDILFAFPGANLVLDSDGVLHRSGTNPSRSDFLDSLDQWWSELGPDGCDESRPQLPFAGGWFLYLGYELADQIEPNLKFPHADSLLPKAFAVRCPAALIRDHARGQVHLVAETGSSELLELMQRDLFEATELQAPEAPETVIEEDDPGRFVEGVDRIKRYIVEGDTFQVNLSRAWRTRLRHPVEPHAVYQMLRTRNPAPFAGLAVWNDAAIVSSSPERLVCVRHGMVETRPIAGTRPRGREAKADRANSDELLAHPKERAEHIMLIDLERNDLGRVCTPGSIEVNELMAIESYAHVHHIVSNVRGRLGPDITPGRVIRAVFPGGTITGCPKVRCMEIIAELEQTARGAYTGSMGYLNRNGDMDLNILIRTLVQKGSEISLRAGAGIVADSVPEQELDETRAKARGLLLALNPHA